MSVTTLKTVRSVFPSPTYSPPNGLLFEPPQGNDNGRARRTGIYHVGFSAKVAKSFLPSKSKATDPAGAAVGVTAAEANRISPKAKIGISRAVSVINAAAFFERLHTSEILKVLNREIVREIVFETATANFLPLVLLVPLVFVISFFLQNRFATGNARSFLNKYAVPTGFISGFIDGSQ